MQREKKLKIQAPWYETPYLIYQVHENNTYDLIDKDGKFFRSRVKGKTWSYIMIILEYLSTLRFQIEFS